jgi:Domain of unknown function (DUF5679)
MILVIIVGLTTSILANLAIDRVMTKRAKRRLVEKLIEEHTGKFTGFCVFCKEKQLFAGDIVETTSGRRIAKGKCPTCNGSMNRILGRA